MSIRLRSRDGGDPADSYRCPDLGPRGLALIPRQLDDGVHALLATIPPKGNSGLVAGDRAALVIDAGVTSGVSQMIQDLAGSLSSRPVQAQRLPDMHGDSTALDDVTRWRLPDTLGRSLEIDLGGVTVQLWHFGPGSSPGDTVVYVPHARAAWTGDFLNHAGLPPIRLEGCPLAYAASLRRMRDLLPELQTVVPGHGPHSCLAGLAASLHRANIMATYQSLERRERARGSGIAIARPQGPPLTGRPRMADVGLRKRPR